MITLTQDPKAWAEGLKAGETGKARQCPYLAGSREAWSWWSGWVEGDAKRTNSAVLQDHFHSQLSCARRRYCATSSGGNHAEV